MAIVMNYGTALYLGLALFTHLFNYLFLDNHVFWKQLI